MFAVVVTFAVNTPAAAPIFPTLALPLAFNVPATFIPVPVTTTTLAVPPLEILMLPPEVGMFTFEVPLTIVLFARAVTLVNRPPSPENNTAVATLPKLEFAELATFKPVNVPSEVTLGCAAVVKVPVSNDAPTVPELA